MRRATTQLLRVQVLLDAAQRRALRLIAKRERRSVSAILREIIDRGLEHRMREQQAWKSALARLKARRDANRQRGVYSGDLIAETRAEREQEIERLWRKSS